MVPAHRHRTAWVPAASFPVNRVDALFSRVFGEDGGQAGPARPVAPLAIWEDDDHLWVEVEAPGVAESGVDITVHKETLTLKVERKAEEGRRFLYNGRATGPIEHTVTLPVAVDADKVRATLRDGLLLVELPKSHEAKPRKIGINAG